MKYSLSIPYFCILQQGPWTRMETGLKKLYWLFQCYFACFVKFVCIGCLCVLVCVCICLSVCVSVGRVRRDSPSVTHGWPLDSQLKRWPVTQSDFNLPWEVMVCSLTLNLFLSLHLSRNYKHTCILPHDCVWEPHACACAHAHNVFSYCCEPVRIDKHVQVCSSDSLSECVVMSFPQASNVRSGALKLQWVCKSAQDLCLWGTSRQTHVRTQNYYLETTCNSSIF